MTRPPEGWAMIRVETFTEAAGPKPNEDAFVVRPHPHPQDPSAVICVVADGQGGRAGGARAARLACDATAFVAAQGGPDDLRQEGLWPGLLRIPDLAVAEDQEAGFTTLLAFYATTDRVTGAWAGDTGLLLVTESRGVILTRGHDRNPPVGSGDASPVGFSAPLRSPWKLLAVTDGVWKYVGWNRVIEAARGYTGRALLAELEHAARLPGSGRFQDDFTAVLLECDPG